MYLQIADVVRTQVTNGDYQLGQVLPAEREFMEQFSVSRVTVRRALKELVNEALLESRQGSGYVVQSTSHLKQPLNRITSFSEDCRLRGLTPGSILVSRKSAKSNKDESAHFAVPLGTEVLRVRRVRTGDGEPLLLDHATLLASNAPEWPWPQGSLYSAMKRTNIIPTRVKQQYHPVLATRSLASRLDVDEGSPLMLVIRAGFAVDNSPVEYSHCWFRPDRWTFAHEIRR
jgi:GntR family transcriptional regulator